MAATSSTPNYELPIYEADDTTSWLTDFNGAMEKIDTALHELSEGGGGGGGSVPVVQEIGQSTTAVMSQKATTDQLGLISTATHNAATTANTALSTANSKQNQLVSEGEGQNIKTIGGQSILGTGDISVGGGSLPQVTYATTQTIGGNATNVALCSLTLEPGHYLLHGVTISTGQNGKIGLNCVSTDTSKASIIQALSNTVASNANGDNAPIIYYAICTVTETVQITLTATNAVNFATYIDHPKFIAIPIQ